jgi:hypothetical protein
MNSPSAEEQQEQQEHLAAALDICIQHCLAAEDVARLWSSSRALQQLCRSLLSSALLLRSVAAAAAQAEAEAAAAALADEAAALVDKAAVAAAAAAGPAIECSSMKALRWLLHQPTVTAAMINQCSQQPLAIPCVPLAAAVALVRAGLRVQITAQQLVAAAYECFEGSEVWVAAFVHVWVPLQEWAADLPIELQATAA